MHLIAVAGGAEGTSISFRLTNQSKHVIRAVYVSPSADADWGSDLLAGQALQPGETRRLQFSDGCRPQDVRLVADRGTEFLEEELVFCAANAGELHITLTNRAMKRTWITPVEAEGQ